ncbi:hypothetical protein PM082_015144 [Marasmius tenuissimus]|nr:hypothetical protein PM082_015144 [Marasmius tenuissimus]
MSYRNLGVIDISDTDSDSESLPPSSQVDYPPTSSQPASDIELIDISSDDEQAEEDCPQAANLGFSSPRGSYGDLSDDDSLPDLSVALSQSQPSGSARPTKRDRTSSFGNSQYSLTDGSPSKRSRTSARSTGSSSASGGSDDESEPPLTQEAGPSKPKRHGRVSSEEKARRAREKEEEKQRKQYEKEQEKQRKEREKEQKKAETEREKAEKKAQKQQERDERKAIQAQDKAENAAFKKANTLKRDKKAILPCMQVLFSDALTRKHSELSQLVTSALRERNPEAKRIISDASPFQNYKTIRWRKHHTEKFNPKDRQWDVCEEYDAFERTALLWIDGADLVKDLGNLKTIVQEFRSHYDLTGCDDQTFILFHGVERHPGLNHDEVDKVLAELQMTMHTHHIFCNKLEDTATRLYNLTADLGTRSSSLHPETWSQMIDPVLFLSLIAMKPHKLYIPAVSPNLALY